MFTEKDNTYWSAFSAVIKGDFVERKYWHSPKVRYEYKGLEVVFDTYYFTSTVGAKSHESFITRVYAKFTYWEPLKAKIEKASLFNRLVNLFNGQLYKTKDRKFDRCFHIHATHPKILGLFHSTLRQKLIDLSIEGMFIDTYDGIWGDPLPKNQYEISIYLDQSRLTLEELVALKALFEQILDALYVQFDTIAAIKPL